MRQYESELDALMVKAYEDSRFAKTKRLIKNGANPNVIINEHDKTFFMRVAHDGLNGMIKTMLKYKADIHLVEKEFGFNAFLFAHQLFLPLIQDPYQKNPEM